MTSHYFTLCREDVTSSNHFRIRCESWRRPINSSLILAKRFRLPWGSISETELGSIPVAAGFSPGLEPQLKIFGSARRQIPPPNWSVLTHSLRFPVQNCPREYIFGGSDHIIFLGHSLIRGFRDLSTIGKCRNLSREASSSASLQPSPML